MNSKHLATGSACPPFQDGKLRIYSTPFCPYCHKVLLTIKAKGIPHDIVNVNLANKPTWLWERNPTGAVPVIETPQGPLYESLIVMEYLDEVYPHQKLASADPYQKAMDKIWIEKSSKFAGYLFSLMKGVSDETEVTENRFKQFKELLTAFEIELKRRGTKFFGGQKAGILDFSLWPWFERFPALKLAYPTYAFETVKVQDSALEKWSNTMMEEDAVKKWYHTREAHYKVLNDFVNGVPEYD